MFDFEIKIAETEEEIKGAKKLRYDIFHVEAATNLDSNSHLQENIDEDKYDKFCEHLIVIDKSINRIVGAYRLLPSFRVDSEIGFHSEESFNIDDLNNMFLECTYK